MNVTMDLREMNEASREGDLAAQLNRMEEGQSLTLVDRNDPIDLLKRIESGLGRALLVQYLEKKPAFRLKLTVADTEELSREDAGCCGGCGG